MDIKVREKRDYRQQIDHIIESIRNHAVETPKKSALIFLEDDKEQENITYSDFYERIFILASHLSEYTGKRALLLYPSGIDYVIAFFACLMAKVLAVPAYPPTNERNIGRVNSIVKNSQATLILSDSTTMGRNYAFGSAPSGLEILMTDIDINRTVEFTPPEIEPEDTAFLQYTSGSISDPKGVVLTHANIMHNIRKIERCFKTTRESVMVSWLPLYHDMGLIGSIIHPINTGATTVFMSSQSFLQKPFRWLQAISDYRGTIAGAPNFAYEYCVRKIKHDSCPELDLSSWDVAFNGAEPVHPETLERFSKKFSAFGFGERAFLPCYGMAESTLYVAGTTDYSVLSLGRDCYANNNIQLSDGYKSIRLVGYPLPENYDDLRIMEPSTLELCEEKSVGEIWLKGKSVSGRYWNNPEVSRKTFQAHTACGEGPYLRTGDLGFVDNGHLFVTGRLKDVIIIHGENYYPQDLEYCILQTDSALVPNSCAAFSIENESQESFAVMIERPRGLKTGFSELCARIRTRLVDEFGVQPREIFFTRQGEIPKTSSGKIQHQACRDKYLTDSIKFIHKDVTSPEPVSVEESGTRMKNLQNLSDDNVRQGIEKYLTGLFSEILKCDEQSIVAGESLFELGLESITGVEACYRISEDLCMDVEPSLLVDMPTVKDLAIAIVNMVGKERLRAGDADAFSKQEMEQLL